MLRSLAIGVFATSTLILSACGGGGGSGSSQSPTPPPLENQSVGGIWKSTYSIASGANAGNTVNSIALATETGQFFEFDQNTTTRCAALAFGNLSVTGSSVTGSGNDVLISYAPGTDINPSCVYSDGTTSAAGTLSGTVTQRQSLTITAQGKTSAGTALPATSTTWTFDSTYLDASSLTAISGDYADNGDVFSISASGEISETDQNGCVITGQITTIDTTYNAYNIELSFVGCTGSPAAAFNGSTLTGIAALDTSVSPSNLVFGVSGTANGAVVGIGKILSFQSAFLASSSGSSSSSSTSSSSGGSSGSSSSSSSGGTSSSSSSSSSSTSSSSGGSSSSSGGTSSSSSSSSSSGGSSSGSAVLSLSAQALSFADQAAGSTSAAQTITVTNTGTMTLSITNVTIGGANPGAFNSTNVCVGTFAPNATCSIAVIFGPSSVGPASAMISVLSNASSSTTLVPLTGNGVAPSGFAYVAKNDGTISQFAISSGGALAPLLTPIAAGTVIGNIDWITVDPTGSYVYSLVYDPFNFSGVIGEYSIGASGTLTMLGEVPTNVFPLFMTITPNGANAFVGGGEGLIAQFSQASGGSLVATGSAVFTSTSSNLYGAAIDPTGSYAYFADGNQSIWAYTVSAGGSLQPGPVATYSANNPFAVAIHPSGRYAYIGNSSDTAGSVANVAQYNIGPGGVLTPMTIGTIPTARPVEIAIHPSGNFAYVLNGSSPATISQYVIGGDGSLSPMSVATVLTGIISVPASMAFDPTGSYLYVVSNYDGTVSQYTIGPTGALTAMSTPTVKICTGCGPVAIAIAP